MKPGVDYIAITTPFFCHDGNGKFVVHRRSPKCRDEVGRWDIGGGQLEFGESAESAVLREVREEYGCAGTIDRQLPAFSLIRSEGDVRTHWLVIPFIIRVDPTEVRMNDPEAMDGIQWATLNGFPQPLHSGAAIILDRYRHLIDDLLKQNHPA